MAFDKRRFWQSLRCLPRLTVQNIVLTILPALIIVAAHVARPILIDTRCAAQPTLCDPATLTATERWSVNRENHGFKVAGNTVQKVGTLIALATPLVLHAAALGTPQGLVVHAGADLLLLMQTALWNAAALEWTRIAVQRPRPKLYSDPSYGRDPTRDVQYTSFYSGHTSYIASITTMLVLILLRHGVRRRWIVAAAGFMAGSTLLTAVSRLMDGQHFVGDVVAAALAGPLVAIAVAAMNRLEISKGRDRPLAVAPVNPPAEGH
jgi:membrane-associated phospholipid phosphatase